MKQNKETVPPAGPVADSHITSQTGWFEEVAIHWTNVPGSTAYQVIHRMLVKRSLSRGSHRAVMDRQCYIVTG